MSETEPADLSDLVRSGILQFALQPPMNPDHLRFARYTVPLIEHDYPAKTAAMWNSAYQALGMDIGNIMMTGDTKHAEVIFEALRRDPRYMGGGAGVGFKEKAFSIADEVDSFASAAGAVNFVSMRDGRLCGHNTDGVGFVAALEAVLHEGGQTLADKIVLMIGAGGTARSVAVALVSRGAHLHIVNRTHEKAAAMVARLNTQFADEVAHHADEEEIGRLAPMADVIVNVSTKGAAGPLERYSALARADTPATQDTVRCNLMESNALLDQIPRSTILCDVVIAQGGTPFLRQGREKGFKTLDGIPMVVNQAVEAFWILHGSELHNSRISKGDVAVVMYTAAETDLR